MVIKMIDEKILIDILKQNYFDLDENQDTAKAGWWCCGSNDINISILGQLIQNYITKTERVVSAKDIPTEKPVYSKMETTEQSALDIAKELIYSERQAQYGTFKNNMTTLSEIFALLTKIKLTEQQCTQFLIALKLARESNKHKRDNLVDVIGYIALLDDLKNRE